MKFGLLVLPGAALLYGVLTLVWDLPNPVGVLTVLAALTMLLGLLMGTRDKHETEYDGELVTTEMDADTGLPHLQLKITSDPRTFVDKQTIQLRSVDDRSVV